MCFTTYFCIVLKSVPQQYSFIKMWFFALQTTICWGCDAAVCQSKMDGKYTVYSVEAYFEKEGLGINGRCCGFLQGQKAI